MTIKPRTLSIDEARRIATVQGIKPAKLKGTNIYELLRTLTSNHEQVTWEELKKGVEENGLAIYESGGYLRIVRIRETGF